MSNNVNEFKTPYLVQRGSFKRVDKNEITGLDSLIRYDYMGSSEFEWGALPKSLKRMLWSGEEYTFKTLNELKSKDGNCARIYCKKSEIDMVIKQVEWLSQNSYGMKEYCNFATYFGDNESYSVYKEQNFWWDIDNDYMVFFDVENEEKLSIAFDKMKERNILK